MPDHAGIREEEVPIIVLIWEFLGMEARTLHFVNMQEGSGAYDLDLQMEMEMNNGIRERETDIKKTNQEKWITKDEKRRGFPCLTSNYLPTSVC